VVDKARRGFCPEKGHLWDSFADLLPETVDPGVCLLAERRRQPSTNIRLEHLVGPVKRAACAGMNPRMPAILHTLQILWVWLRTCVIVWKSVAMRAVIGDHELSYSCCACVLAKRNLTSPHSDSMREPEGMPQKNSLSAKLPNRGACSTQAPPLRLTTRMRQSLRH
jgi:hypothetical protein